MTQETDKFNLIYNDLIKLVYWYANTYATNNIMMDRDDIVGELLLEMSKAFEAYGDRDPEEIKRLLQQMMKHRISELKYRYYVTHRNAENIAESLDAETDEGMLIAEYVGYTHEMDGFAYVEEVKGQLSETANEVLDLVMNWNQRLCDVFDLSMMRANSVYKNNRAILRPHHIAEAMMMDVREVKKAWKEIQEVVART